MPLDARLLGLGGKRGHGRTAAGSAAFSCNDDLPQARIRHADRTGGLNEEYLPRKQREDKCLLSLGDAVVPVVGAVSQHAPVCSGS